MRHIDIDDLLQGCFATPDGVDVKARLFKAHKKVAVKPPSDRQTYIRNNGPAKWSPLKNVLTELVGNKCWYTEVEVVGSSLAIDHFRPACDYWWLAFEAGNYRVSCSFSNSPKENLLYGCAGGKGMQFPLLNPCGKATGKNKLRLEKPVILDPCDPRDCALVAFQADGRPVIHPAHKADRVAIDRLQRSNLLLNLDHPDFNAKREELYHEILSDVQEHEDPHCSALSRQRIVERMGRRLLPTAPFSTAARFYMQFYRAHGWVENVLSN